MKKLIGTFLLLAASATISLAQYVDYGKAMISYSDGSFFLGEILEQDQTGWKFKLSTGDTIHLNPYRIERVLSEAEIFVFNRNKYHIKKGLFLNSSFMFHAGWENTVQWDGTVGYGLTERWDVGLGLGISGHDMDLGTDWVSHEFVNIYGYGRFFLNNRKMRLYLDSKMGFAVPLLSSWDIDDDHSGGFFLQPGVGFIFSSKSAYKWNVGLSQYILNTKGNTTSFGNFGNPIEVEYDVWYNRTVFQFGLSIMLTPRQLRDFSLFR